MSLDLAVARAIHANHVLERALHEPRGWTIALGSMHLPVVREVFSTGVSFTTHLPALELIQSLPLGLYHRGVLQDCREARPGEDLSEVVWELALTSAVAA